MDNERSYEYKASFWKILGFIFMTPFGVTMLSVFTEPKADIRLWQIVVQLLLTGAGVICIIRGWRVLKD